MSSIGSRLAGVGLGALFVIGLGGAGLAYAQTTGNSTPSMTSPSAATAPAAPGQDPNCPHDGRGGGGGGGGRGFGRSAGGGSVSPTPAPAPSGGTDPGSL